MKLFSSIALLFVMFNFFNVHSSSAFETMKAKYQIQRVHYIAYHNKLDELRVIIKSNDTCINAVDKFGNTGLHYAAYYNRKHVVNLLLNAGAQVDIKNNLGDTPLLLATMKSNQDIMIMLCEHNANVYMKNREGKCPIESSDEVQKDILITVNFLSHT